MRRWLVCLLLIGCICRAETKFVPKPPRPVLILQPVKANPFAEKSAASSGTVFPANFMGFLGKNPFTNIIPVFVPPTNEARTETIANGESSVKEANSNNQIKVSPSKVNPSLDRLILL